MSGNIDAQIMQWRALGYSQAEIARMLGIAQSTVSQRLENINRMSQTQDPQKLFWNLIIGSIGLALIMKIFDEFSKE